MGGCLAMDIMRDTAELDKISAAIESLLKQDFENVRILKVSVREDEDRDGDEILRVEVVFEGDTRAFDAQKLSGVVRHIRPALREMGEKAFPLMSFISSREARARRFAPA